MALFLKYRPQNFEEIVGQDALKKTLSNALSSDKQAHAYLFSGSRGTGKTSTARIFAKALNCQNLSPKGPCNECSFCTQANEGRLIDLIEIDAASHTSVDNIRDIIDKIRFAPSQTGKKVYIIDEVHMLSKGAFNALLKTLEEPPDYAYFCLATTELHKVPETIISRCQTFFFERFTMDQMVGRLEYICQQEGFQYEIPALQIMAKKAEGGLRDAISTLDQLAAETEQNLTEELVRTSLGLSSQEEIESLYNALKSQTPQPALDILRNISEKGGNLRMFGQDFLFLLRQKMLASLSDPAESAFILRTIESVQKALQRLKTSPIVELPLEVAVIELCANLDAPAPASQRPQAISTPAPARPPASPIQQPAPVVPTPIPEAKSPVQPTTAKEKPAPKTAQSPTAPPENLKDAIPLIAQKANLSLLIKKDFLNGLISQDGDMVTFHISSDFAKNKLSEPELFQAIQIATQEVLNLPSVSVNFVKNETAAQAATGPISEDDFISF